MTRSGLYSAPIVSVQETVHHRVVERIAHVFLQGFPDLGRCCYFPRRGPLEERPQKQAFFLHRHVRVSAPTCSRTQDALQAGSVVRRNPIVYTVNRDPRMQGYLLSWSRIHRRIQDYQQFQSGPAIFLYSSNAARSSFSDTCGQALVILPITTSQKLGRR